MTGPITPLSVSDELSRIGTGPIVIACAGAPQRQAHHVPCALPSTTTNTPQSNMQGYPQAIVLHQMQDLALPSAAPNRPDSFGAL